MAKTVRSNPGTVKPGTAKRSAKEVLRPIDLRHRHSGIATEKHPHLEEGTEFEAHPELMKHFVERGFAIAEDFIDPNAAETEE